MPQAVATKAVPIRLAYRYPNGCMISYSARAVSRKASSIRIIVNEEFDEGTSLAVMAPFLDGLTMGRVSAVSRSKKQPGYFEIILQFGEGELSHSGESLEEEQPEMGAGAPRHATRPEPVSSDFGEAATELIQKLEVVPPPPLWDALQRMDDGSREPGLFVAVGAALQLLDEKGIVQARPLVSGSKEAPQK
jgi:hypothetical protein